MGRAGGEALVPRLRTIVPTTLNPRMSLPRAAWRSPFPQIQPAAVGREGDRLDPVGMISQRVAIHLVSPAWGSVPSLAFLACGGGTRARLEAGPPGGSWTCGV